MNSDSMRIDSQPYLVALLDADTIPADTRIAAETRFAAVLERSLGNAAQVACSCRAWAAVSECAAPEVGRETIEAAMRWPRALELARQAGLREIGDIPAAHFEVKLRQA